MLTRHPGLYRHKTITEPKERRKCGNEIHSDALRSSRAALREGYVYHYQVFDQNSGALRWVRALISNLKSFLLGTYHGLGNKHPQSCFDEFSFRFNRSPRTEQLFPRPIAAAAASPASWAMMT